MKQKLVSCQWLVLKMVFLETILLKLVSGKMLRKDIAIFRMEI